MIWKDVKEKEKEKANRNTNKKNLSMHGIGDYLFSHNQLPNKTSKLKQLKHMYTKNKYRNFFLTREMMV